MKGMMLTASLALAFAGSAVAHTPSSCHTTYSVKAAQHAARLTYRGTRNVSARDRAGLSRVVRCLRNPRAVPYVRWYVAHRRALWVAARTPHYNPDVASWYDDAGGTACGFHAYYGVANRTLPCGTLVDFKLGGRTVTATVEDRGPFVGGRNWDLNQNTAAALGFGGVGTIWVHVR